VEGRQSPGCGVRVTLHGLIESDLGGEELELLVNGPPVSRG
jgi:hypothetical protein